MNKLKVAVVGAGYLGKHHARIYSKFKDVELVAICDAMARRARKIARQYHSTPYTDYSQILEKVDAVSIAVPTEKHFPIAKDFLSQKVHVLLEKPITNNLAQAEELVRLAEEKNAILQVGHLERFNAAVESAESLIKKPLFIECHRLGPFKKRSIDVSVVLDLMIHDIEIILAFIKSPIASIDAVGVPVLSAHEDIANVRLRCQDGEVINLTASRLSKKEMRKIRIFQKNTYISLDYTKQDVQIYTLDGKKIRRSRTRIKPAEPLKKELESFVSCIQNNKKPKVSGKEATQALSIALEIVNQIKQ